MATSYLAHYSSFHLLSFWLDQPVIPQMSTIKNTSISILPRLLDGEISSFDYYKLHVEFTDFDPNKDSIIFLHGYMGSIDDYDPVIELFADNYNIVAIDHRGHGDSDTPSMEITWQIQDFAYDIYQVINFLIPPGHQVNIVASSLSTAVALEFAYQYPECVDKMFLISPTYKFNISFFNKLIMSIGKVAPDVFLTKLIDLLHSVSPHFVFDEFEKQMVIEGFAKIKNLDMKTHKKILMETIRNWELESLDLDMKILILAGEDDKVVNYKDSKQLNEKLRNSTMITLKDTKHSIIQKRPELIIGLLEQWLSSSNSILEKKFYDDEDLIGDRLNPSII